MNIRHRVEQVADLPPGLATVLGILVLALVIGLAWALLRLLEHARTAARGAPGGGASNPPSSSVPHHARRYRERSPLKTRQAAANRKQPLTHTPLLATGEAGRRARAVPQPRPHVVVGKGSTTLSDRGIQKRGWTGGPPTTMGSDTELAQERLSDTLRAVP